MSSCVRTVIPEKYEQHVFAFQPDDDFYEAASSRIGADEERQQLPEESVLSYEAGNTESWNKFYVANATGFFRDRRYLTREFDIDMEKGGGGAGGGGGGGASCTLVEFGCGVGNTLIPLLEAHPSLVGIGVDCSSVAIDLLHKRVEQQGWQGRCTSRVVDMMHPGEALDDIAGKADYVSMLFALGACSPSSFAVVVEAAAKMLKPGGYLLFRDYAKFDLAQLRLADKAQTRLSNNFYVRGDGTRAYFFAEEEVASLFAQVGRGGEGEGGLECISLYTQAKVFVNRKTQVTMNRLWVQGKWQKKMA